MNRSIQRIFEGIVSGKIDKQTGAEILGLLKEEVKSENKDVAIIGISAKLPMGESLDEIWKSISSGEDCISDFPELRKQDADDYIMQTKGETTTQYSKAAYLKEIDKFDYNFFRISPKEASLMSPNQKLFLETAFEAVDDAGYGGKKLAGTKTGVYTAFNGDEFYDYKSFILQYEPTSASNAFPGNFTPLISNRVSYVMDLKGPSMVIDTGCSSSLVAVHQACKSIRSGECDLALAGSVRVNLLRPENQLETGMESSDGRAKTFDDSSDGTGSGEGVVVFLLKPLNKAVKDNDNIYAVIKGSAVTQDGSSIGITAPNVLAQEEAIVEAWRDAQINPETIEYIEAHGTGTKLGDPIEIDGIQRAFKRYTNKKQFCAVGSIKTNIGHLDHAAGMAGLLKVVLALKYKQLPPIVHFLRPNRKINFCSTALYVNDTLIDWGKGNEPRRCGVSSFGLGGTNCHVVIEEAPDTLIDVSLDKREYHIFTMSAKSKDSLDKLINSYKQFVNNSEKTCIQDICYTANTGRGHYNYRIAFIIRSIEEFNEIINSLESEELDHNSQIYYAEHKVFTSNRKPKSIFEITEEQVRKLDDEAKKLILRYSEENNVTSTILNELCKLYISGANINWDNLYNEHIGKKVSIPYYQFERNRCWVETPQTSSAIDLISSQNLLYEIKWQKTQLTGENYFMQGSIIVFTNNEETSSEVISLLENQNLNVIQVRLGKEFAKESEDKYIINNNQEGYIRFFQNISNRKISKILHMLSANSKELASVNDLELSQQNGIYSLFYITKAILHCSITDNIDIVLVSSYVNKVIGTEVLINPQNATMFGFAKVVSKEHFNLNCKCFDIDKNVNAEDISKMLFGTSSYFQIAYREGSQYIESLEEFDIATTEADKVEVRKNGVYIITGGTGGIGLEIGKFIASKNKVRLILINRSKFPEKKFWDKILSDNLDLNLSDKIKKIIQIEKLGTEVVILAADISKEVEAAEILFSLRANYGKINGIIHAAGNPGLGFIAEKKEEQIETVMCPKVNGTWILDRLTQKDELDFFILFSSASTIYGGLGDSDYTAANSFLDSFASWRNQMGRKTLTINWTAWKETGMGKGINKEGYFKLLETYKAIYGFETIINKKIERAIIGTINYESNEASQVLHDEKLFGIKLSQSIIEKIKKNKKKSFIEDNKENFKNVKLTGKNNGNYTKTEEVVAQVWGSLLGYVEININDNFYELGGDSLIATRIINILIKETGKILEISEFFRNLSIIELANCLDSKDLNGNKEEYVLPAIQSAEEQQYYQLSASQKRIFFANQINKDGIQYNEPIGVRIEGILNKDKLELTVSKLIERHDVLRTSFKFMDGKPVQVIHKQINFLIDYDRAEVGDVSSIGSEFIKPFNLERAPLFRIKLVSVDEENHFMIFDVHHIISDAMSMDILVKDFIELYKGNHLQKLKLQYKDFVIWQNNLFQSDYIKEQENYWINMYSGKIPKLNMPIDYEDQKKGINAKNYNIEITGNLLEEIKKLCSNGGLTRFMVLFGAFNILISKYTLKDDIVIGTPIAGRHHSDLEDVIGVFINTLALRNMPCGYKTVREFLEEVRQNSLNAYNNQDYQFERLVEKLNIQRNLDKNPIFEIMFSMHSLDVSYIDVGDVRFIPYEIYKNVSKFDLELNIKESENKLKINFYFNENLYKTESIEKLAKAYIKIISTIVTNVTICIKDIDILCSEDADIITSILTNSKNKIISEFDF